MSVSRLPCPRHRFSNLGVVVVDNRALSQASKRAQETDVPLIVLFVISPQDYVAHDRGPRKIDFVLRNLESIKVCQHDNQAYSPPRSNQDSLHSVRSKS